MRWGKGKATGQPQAIQGAAGEPPWSIEACTRLVFSLSGQGWKLPDARSKVWLAAAVVLFFPPPAEQECGTSRAQQTRGFGRPFVLFRIGLDYFKEQANRQSTFIDGDDVVHHERRGQSRSNHHHLPLLPQWTDCRVHSDRLPASNSKRTHNRRKWRLGGSHPARIPRIRMLVMGGPWMRKFRNKPSIHPSIIHHRPTGPSRDVMAGLAGRPRVTASRAID